MSGVVIPKRWHVYVVDLEPRVHSKPGKQRPCLAIQPVSFALGGLQSTVVIPLTSKLTKGNAYPLRVRVPKDLCDLTHDSDLMIDQILAWDNRLFKDDLGIIPGSLCQEVKQAVREFLDLEGEA